MRVLVFGKTGQVAQELIRLTASQGIVATFLGRDQADLTNPAHCAAIIERTDADVVVNAAAYTGVDAAQTDAATAQMVNATAPGAMAIAAARRGLPFLHISTDYVFSGASGTPWPETAVTAPQSVYGATKLAGEQAVTRAGGAHVILRTAWVFSSFGANFVKTMRRVGATRDRLTIVDDQHGGPTPAAAIASVLISIAKAFVAGKGRSGIYHFTGTPDVTWADFAQAIFERQANVPTIERIKTSQYPTPAKRPQNSILDCRKIKQDYDIAQPDWRVALALVLQELEAQP